MTDRVAAADALGDVRDPRTADDLLQAAFAEALEVRDAALDALDRLGFAGAVVGVAGVLDPLLGRLAGRPPESRPRFSSGYGATAESSLAAGVASASRASAASIQAVDHRANGVRTVTSRRT